MSFSFFNTDCISCSLSLLAGPFQAVKHVLGVWKAYFIQSSPQVVLLYCLVTTGTWYIGSAKSWPARGTCVLFTRNKRVFLLRKTQHIVMILSVTHLLSVVPGQKVLQTQFARHMLLKIRYTMSRAAESTATATILRLCQLAICRFHKESSWSCQLNLRVVWQLFNSPSFLP